MSTNTLEIFNVALQEVTDWTVDVDGSGEVILTCTADGHFVKFPADATVEDIKAWVADHNKTAPTLVTQKALDEKKATILKGFSEGK